ncbi:MAG: alpha/beta hydrolase [Rhodoferax sp.]|uniref:alpha/beta hydrolase n=1 Tax=Rhodoferax sp. TaxID=50421 RepID=UPI002ACD6020|nr:alpha/beta hydrolase [Rhodoferax sp.]MDZ7891213.1 alpha/beta hydrolase [Rhodoferax sp.]
MNHRISLFFAFLTTLANPAALAAGFSPVDVLNFLTPSRTHTLHEGVTYGPLHRQRLDVYVPRAAQPPKGWPVVVFYYGGSWNRGERAQYRFVGEALASRGILALVADYRLYPEVRYPDFLKDSAAALSYGLDHAADWGGNPDKVYVMGHSAGAYNAAMMALDPRWLAAHGRSPQQLAGWVGLAGPYDFLPLTNVDAMPVFHHPHYPAHSQPLDHVQPGAPRALLLAALEDDLVNPQRNTAGLAERLNAAQVPVLVKMHTRVNHITLVAALSLPLRWMAPVLNDVVQFIQAPGRP